MPRPYVFAVPIKEKLAESVVQAYLSGIFGYKWGSIANPSDNGTELKKHCTQWGMWSPQHQNNIFKPISAPKYLKNQKTCTISSREHLLNI